jgi:pimeloyl-ACP methyl ester carboxylesterase
VLIRPLLVASLLTTLAQSSAVLTDSIQSGFVEVPGGRLFYEAAGHGDTVVLIHDGILHRETWNDQFPALAGEHRLVRYDRRGYGRSTAPTAAYSNVDDLQAIFAALHIDRAALIGCSAGGALAIDFAIAHPDEVRSMVLVGAVVRGLSPSAHFQSRGGRWSPDVDATPAAIEYWAMKDPYYVSEQSPAVKTRVRELLASNPQNFHADAFVQRPSWTALSRLGEIRVPTLIVVGEHDIPDVHADAGAIQAGIQSSTREIIPAAGHLVHMEQPTRFNTLVQSFLSRSR